MEAKIKKRIPVSSLVLPFLYGFSGITALIKIKINGNYELSKNAVLYVYYWIIQPLKAVPIKIPMCLDPKKFEMWRDALDYFCFSSRFSFP